MGRITIGRVKVSLFSFKTASWGPPIMHMNLTSIIRTFHIFRAVLYAAFISFILSMTISAHAQRGGGGGGSPPALAPLEPIVEWDKRQDVGERLAAYGMDLLGDSIDQHTGDLSFQHTDISLPGNSGLAVVLSRQLSSGYFYRGSVDAEFGDWSYNVPRLHVVTASGLFPGTNQWTGARCTNPSSTFTTYVDQNSNVTFPAQYSDGMRLDVPGQGSQQVLLKTTSVTTPFPSSAKYVTDDNWYLTCTTATDGGDGFYAYAPNGDRYRFDRYLQYAYRSTGYMNVNGGNASGTNSLGRVRAMLMATEVTDVNGNWVKYDYDSSGRLTKIHANDGREITLAYSGASKLIASASANGRTWQYNYQTTNIQDTFLGTSFNKPVLSTVTQPDGKSWSFSLAGMFTRPAGGDSCVAPSQTLSITHPYGTTGTFVLNEQNHRGGWANWVYISPLCLGGKFNNNTPAVEDLDHNPMMTMAVISKTLTGANIPTSTWTFSYEQDIHAARYPAGHQNAGHPIASSETDPTNWTKVVDPTGVETTYYHYWSDASTTTGSNFGSKLDRMETRDTAGGTEIARQENDYVETGVFGKSYTPTSYPSSPFMRIPTGIPVRIEKTVTIQDGDTYTSERVYNTNQSSSNYSYGQPIQTSVYSNVSTTPRVTDTTYEHNAAQWILNLPKTVTTNGRDMATYVYDTYGQKTSETRYGALYATYDYRTDGTVYWAKDALLRRTWAYQWKRGTPQEILRPDNKYVYQYVDDNGWLTSTKDAKGNTTSYSRDSMGRLTTYTPPTGWTPTTISYVFGTGVTQTISKGFADSIITYDSLFRPTLVKTFDSKPGVGSTSFVKTTYDALGQNVFTSFPSTSSNPTTGTTTAYDALGRVTSTAENVTPFATTSVDYLNLHRVRTTDPLGKQTTTSTDGYGGPGRGEVLLIEQPEDVNTQIYRNIWGQIDRVRQYGTGDGGYKDESHYYYYNNRQQLCRHFTQSGLGAVFAYDNAGQMTSYNRGVGSGTTCDTPAGNARVDLTYDMLGQVIDTNYTDANTPDISRVYDNNGNLTQVNRGIGASAADWAYTYDNINNLTSELLSVDGGAKSFPMSYGYNADGFMISRALPSGRSLTLVTDGLGRLNKVSEIGQVYAQNIDYHASGAITGMDYGNGQLFTQTLNARLQPLRLLSQKGSTKALDLNYSYDVRGKVTGITNGAITGDNRTYNYDDMGRLTSATGPWGNSNYKYDVLGNIMEKKVGSRTIGMTYNSINRLTSHVDKDGSGNAIPGTTVNLSYDTHGNVTGLGAQQFKYDMAEQPYEILGDVVGDYVYDGNLKRVKAVVAGKTIYNVYDAGGTLVHVDETTDGNVTDYIGKIARIKNGTPTWLHMDHLGSAQTGSSATGAVAWREKYTPYGTTLTNPLSNNNQAGFTGHIKDSATGIIYMQARYMDPFIGRFLSIDPVGFSEGQPQMFNRYSYVNNDPVNHTDPTGMCIGAAIFSPNCQEFIRGVSEGATGSYTAYQLSKGIQQGDPRSLFIGHGMSIGLQLAAHNKGLAADVAGKSLTENLPRFLGRVTGGAGISLAGGKGAGAVFKKLGAGKLAAKGAQASVTVTSFSSGQIAAAATALGGLYDSVSEAGFDPGTISVGALGNSAIISAAGGDISFNSKTGAITARLPATTGSRIRPTVKLDTLKKE